MDISWPVSTAIVSALDVEKQVKDQTLVYHIMTALLVTPSQKNNAYSALCHTGAVDISWPVSTAIVSALDVEKQVKDQTLVYHIMTALLVTPSQKNNAYSALCHTGAVDISWPVSTAIVSALDVEKQVKDQTLVYHIMTALLVTPSQKNNAYSCPLLAIGLKRKSESLRNLLIHQTKTQLVPLSSTRPL